MTEVEEVTEEYIPLANLASRLYFSLDSMSSIHFLYQYSLQYFMEILFSVIEKSEKLDQIPRTNHQARLQFIVHEFLNRTYDNVSRGLLQEHQTLFALRLVQIRKHGDEQFGRLCSILLGSPAALETRLSPSLLDGRLTKSEMATVEGIASVREFSGLIASMESDESRWLAFLDHATAETAVPDPWRQSHPDLSPEVEQLLRLIMVRALRPDRVVAATKTLIALVLGEELLQSG